MEKNKKEGKREGGRKREIFVGKRTFLDDFVEKKKNVE